ncbi:putative acyloxyacyl hydrolase-like [Apostichopus japonicus]|uniref:Putative acyloxyacyl hydrolase-like n=1 Tax=Stichopus japonicus TaxID=307972 RepID=A0A2G8JRD1_STIJA|nr:putative acyloxyacyl hydrolase-like [Apostichopus japonicus]
MDLKKCMVVFSLFAVVALVRGKVNGGSTCAGCTIIVSLAEQIGEINNETVVQGFQRLCNYLPASYQPPCKTFVASVEPTIQQLIDEKFFTPDVACQALTLCTVDPGQPECHLYPLVNKGLAWSASQILPTRAAREKQYHKMRKLGSDICDGFPILKGICQFVYQRLDDHEPLVDADGDRFSIIETLRGTHFRGRDCDDVDSSVHPGKRAIDGDRHRDSNCNGIYGVDPKTGKTYEELLCDGTGQLGVILLGDSAGAHFHIPENWVSAPDISLGAFEILPDVLADEFDWPHLSSMTGYINSSLVKWPTDSAYYRMWQMNHCNHRDYQNLGVNGARSSSMNGTIQYSMSRDQKMDHPALVIYSLIGNDVCNGHPDTIAHMTTPEEMRANFHSTLKFLDTKLPKGSHVIATSMADGRILYDTLHDKIHPLGNWRQDVTYSDLYEFLNCLQISPCMGWMSSNETLRNLTSQRAANLSRALEMEVGAYKSTNFDLHYEVFDITKVLKKWVKEGGHAKDLIEPVDGFHPSQKQTSEMSCLVLQTTQQLANFLSAKKFWEDLDKTFPNGIVKMNPHNNQIRELFGNQGGY